ncbi:pectinesterase inhibitor [Dorcoceras hygrometricum]|uniref:Pectinesterase inhibitor n=1 Tax=Dorcoceras hygrometricum TaxID=472368 RepID=A0A2Z7B4U4_9LAMI|nr:pectinesterase inhibitor [Dorcoceras hygrometricum]
MENPFVLISSGLLVQPDDGVSDLIVDRIGVSTAIYREEPAFSRISNLDSDRVAAIIPGSNDPTESTINSAHGKKSRDQKLKEKYWPCSKKFAESIRDLNEAKQALHKRKYSGMPVLVDDVFDEVKSCHNDFDAGASDPAHIRNRNKEIPSRRGSS